MKKLVSILCVAVAMIMVSTAYVDAKTAKKSKKSGKATTSQTKKAANPVVDSCTIIGDDTVINFYQNGQVDFGGFVDGSYIKDGDAYLLMDGYGSPYVQVSNILINLGGLEDAQPLTFYLQGHCGEIIENPGLLKKIMHYDAPNYRLSYTVNGQTGAIALEEVPAEEITYLQFDE